MYGRLTCRGTAQQVEYTVYCIRHDILSTSTECGKGIKPAASGIKNKFVSLKDSRPGKSPASIQLFAALMWLFYAGDNKPSQLDHYFTLYLKGQFLYLSHICSRLCITESTDDRVFSKGNHE